MREDDCTDMFVDKFLFMAEQLRNVSAMDDVCALHHISTSGLLALGYMVMYIYIYCVCIILDYACIYTTMYTYNYLLNIIYTQPNLMRLYQHVC